MAIFWGLSACKSHVGPGKQDIVYENEENNKKLSKFLFFIDVPHLRDRFDLFLASCRKLEKISLPRSKSWYF